MQGKYEGVNKSSLTAALNVEHNDYADLKCTACCSQNTQSDVGPCDRR